MNPERREQGMERFSYEQRLFDIIEHRYLVSVFFSAIGILRYSKKESVSALPWYLRTYTI